MTVESSAHFIIRFIDIYVYSRVMSLKMKI